MVCPLENEYPSTPSTFNWLSVMEILRSCPIIRYEREKGEEGPSSSHSSSSHKLHSLALALAKQRRLSTCTYMNTHDYFFLLDHHQTSLGDVFSFTEDQTFFLHSSSFQSTSPREGLNEVRGPSERKKILQGSL